MADILERLSKGEISYEMPSGPVWHGPTLLHIDAANEIKALRDRIDVLHSALTPSGDTKAAFWGEFSIEVVDSNPEYDEHFDINSLNLSDFSDEELGRYVRLQSSETLKVKYPIDWTTVKEIMKAIKEYADGISSLSKN